MGSDGSNYRSLKTNSAGEQVVIGSEAVDAVATKEPVMAGACDETGDVQYLKVDRTTGALLVSEADAGSVSENRALANDVTVVSGAAEATILTYANSSGDPKNVHLVNVSCFGQVKFKIKVGVAASEADVDCHIRTSQSNPDVSRDYKYQTSIEVPDGEQMIITAVSLEELPTTVGDVLASAAIHYY